jgi:hypothetical membrane protein
MNDSKSMLLIRLGGFCGILTPIIALTFILISVGFTPWFSWTENWLSDLGGSLNGGTTAAFMFNGGLIIAGLLGIMFAMALRTSGMLNDKLGNLGTTLLLVDMGFLWAIGVFPENTGALHAISTLGFFILLPIVQILVGLSSRRLGLVRLGLLLLILSAFSLIAFPLFFVGPPFGSNAIVQFIPALSISISSLLLGLTLFKYKGRQPEEEIDLTEEMDYHSGGEDGR